MSSFKQNYVIVLAKACTKCQCISWASGLKNLPQRNPEKKYTRPIFYILVFGFKEFTFFGMWPRIQLSSTEALQCYFV